MHCEKVQQELSVGNDQEINIIRHLQGCQRCQEFRRFDKELLTKVKQFENDDVPSTLEHRISQAVNGRQRGLCPPYRLIAGIGSCAASLLLFMSLSHGGSAEAAYRTMKTQISKVSSVHLTVSWQTSPGVNAPLNKVYELWWMPGKWREKAPEDQGGDRLKLSQNGETRFYRYKPTEHQVWDAKEVAVQPSNFSLEAIANQYMDTPDLYEKDSQPNGIDIITATNRGKWSRMIFTVDRSSSLPIRADKQFKADGTWHTSGHLEFEFNKRIPLSVFEPSDLIPKP